MPRRTRAQRVTTIAALAITTALALSACSPGAAESESSSSDASLTLAITNVPNSIDPSVLSQSPDATIWSALYDRLLSVDPDGTYVPNAAESWEYSDDGLTLTLTLRDDLSFSSGTPIDSAAVVSTIEYVRKNPGAGQTGWRLATSVEAPDPRTVVITLSQPDPLLLDGLATYLGVIADPATLGDPDNAQHPLESGPYTLDTDATVTGSVYVMKRRDDYWNADAYPFETFTVKAITDYQALYNALSSGELDAGYAPSDQIPSLEGNGFTNHVIEGQGTAGLVLADREGEILPALADVRVRRAINMAIDREGFVKQVLAGAGTAAEQKVAPGAAGYVEELNEAYPYDLDKAKALMAEAGYADGFDVTMPSNFLSQSYEPIIGQALRDIGITVNWQVMQAQDPIWESLRFPMGFWVDGGSNTANVLIQNYGPDGSFNPWHVTDPQLDELFAAAYAATDDAAAASAWEAINRYAVDQALSAPMFFTQANMVTRPGISYLGTAPPSITTVNLYDVED